MGPKELFRRHRLCRQCEKIVDYTELVRLRLRRDVGALACQTLSDSLEQFAIAITRVSVNLIQVLKCWYKFVRRTIRAHGGSDSRIVLRLPKVSSLSLSKDLRNTRLRYEKETLQLDRQLLEACPFPWSNGVVYSFAIVSQNARRPSSSYKSAPMVELR